MSCLELLKPVTERVLAAGALLAAEWERPNGPRGHGDKAEIDAEIEVVLRAGLLELLDCDFWGEETGSRLTDHEYCWVVDPNDGTSDFLLGRKGSAVSVGLLRNARPVLGVVYAPVTPDRGPDCVSWATGCSHVIRNGREVLSQLAHATMVPGSHVLVSTAAANKPELNAELCAPADFIPMPSIAYRLARVAAGDAVACASLVPVSAHDVVGGHALLIGAHGVLLNQDGHPISYDSKAQMATVSQRCFGGAPEACSDLVQRDWNRLFGDRPDTSGY
ncbi:MULTISPECIES: inositol monophosphatase family protein [Pseudomonas]|uniref:inositol monophosphatase family protein n=1 Tax=Pseudomonas TaxID=286 RepID=UPI00093AB76C|nr:MULTISPECIES: inositol monophosphatase family protein [Pseudomonas]MDA3395736.1 inositol monophosphatase [Pseudomonas aeruginosa]HCT5749966.1 inositol monophosphatase [Pseudomonas aeruginosa]